MNIENSGIEQIDEVVVEKTELQSEYLKRTVRVDFYHADAGDQPAKYELLLVNDGQDLVKMDFKKILHVSFKDKQVRPIIIVGIHCSDDRQNEYGMSAGPDFQGWGAKAAMYEKFIVEELMPFIRERFHHIRFIRTGYAGFSLGGLSAFDIAWNHPEIFSLVAVFSGSLWWRNVDKSDKSYDPWVNRMMHRQVALAPIRPGMKFFFECGEHDEEEDRNKNGVIDSIDDTIDLMRLLMQKGYKENKDFFYMQMADGRHDVESWKKAWPGFLKIMNRQS